MRSYFSLKTSNGFPHERIFTGNGQKREYLVFFWPKTDVPENNSGRECCWPYLIGQHPLSPVLAKSDRVEWASNRVISEVVLDGAGALALQV